MERFWNRIHYMVYKADYRVHLACNKINPVLYFYKLPFAKRHFKKIGVNPVNEVNKAFKRTDFGVSTIIAGGFIYGLVGLMCLGIVNLYSAATQRMLDLELYHFLGFFVISYVINHFLLFKKDKYLVYFKEFEKMPKEEKRNWAWISFFTIMSMITFIIGSFVVMINRVNGPNWF